jgi:hypothetical protein
MIYSRGEVIYSGRGFDLFVRRVIECEIKDAADQPH